MLLKYPDLFFSYIYIWITKHIMEASCHAIFELGVSVVLQNRKQPVPQLFFVQVKQFHFVAN